MLNASLAWLGDGRQLAVFEACCATLAASRGSGSLAAGYASRLIVVSVPRDGGLTARRVTGPGANVTPESVGSDTARPNSVLASSFLRGDRAAVYRTMLGSSRATQSQVLTIAHAQILAVGPTGRRDRGARLLHLRACSEGFGRGMGSAAFSAHRCGGRAQMLTIGKLGASRGRLEYYDAQVAKGAEDYYAARGEAPGTWRGAGAGGVGLASARGGHHDCLASQR
jgi:hypothetical protein